MADLSKYVKPLEWDESDVVTMLSIVALTVGGVDRRRVEIKHTENVLSALTPEARDTLTKLAEGYVLVPAETHQINQELRERVRDFWANDGTGFWLRDFARKHLSE